MKETDKNFSRSWEHARNACISVATGMSVLEASKRFSRIALKSTPPLVRGWKRKDHTQFLRQRIKDIGLPRRRMRKPAFVRHMQILRQKGGRQRYLREALRRQGEMLAGWNAAARLSGLRVPAWISRHGEVHGSAAVRKMPSGRRAEIRYTAQKASRGRRWNLSRFARDAASRVERGLKANAEAILRKRLKSKKG